MKIVDEGAANTKKSLLNTGNIASGFAYPWSGAMWSPGTQMMQPVDLSSKSGITFWSKGDGGTYRVMVFAQSKGIAPVQQEVIAGAGLRAQTIRWRAIELDGN